MIHVTAIGDVRLDMPYTLQWALSRLTQGGHWLCIVVLIAVMWLALDARRNAQAQGTCTSNPIVCENAKPGNPDTEWDIIGAGSSNIQGFATDISVNKGETVHFKVDTNATAYRLDIYRMGYYGGLGARKVASITPTAHLPQQQPACLTDASSGLIDCGNWAESASWAVPSTATSGIYFAKLVRTDGVSGASHIVFIVRDDSSGSDILFQTSDPTWQAYNDYGGNSLYVGGPGGVPPDLYGGRAYKVSYNRPFNTRADRPEDWVFYAEYPMVRWLEANGYNVSYFTGVDSDRRGSAILNHRVFIAVGHDEYWSAGQRASVEAARAAGVHLAFFSGNEIFWKTRWETSIDGSGTPYRTLVCYKETHSNAKIDPLSTVWTGTWEDPRFSPPADGSRPQNALIGSLFTVNCCGSAITVPQADGRMRFWRNTSIATLGSGQVAILPDSTLGYEWGEDVDDGIRPAGLIWLSTTTVSVPQQLHDYGSTYGPGTATHHLTLYRHSSGALVFGASTVQWSWGLDDNHDTSQYASFAPAPDVDMQQAMVNLLADMHVQPGTLQAGLVVATASTDTTPPISTITAPAAGATVQSGQIVTITGTASDVGGGVVGAVEVSVDGGVTWHPATGRATWSYSWKPGLEGSVTIMSRAVDDSGNLESSPHSITVSVQGKNCPCSLWSTTTTPTVTAVSDGNAVELGVKFQASLAGFITGLRFYKGTTNAGPHVGHLWTSDGRLLASATFTNESASGWQQVTFPSPVPIAANTTYIASYHTSVGHYAADDGYFATAGFVNPPLQALAIGPVNGGNGVYLQGSGGFPTWTFNGTNYWVDVVFNTTGSSTPTVIAMSEADGATNIDPGAGVTATFSQAMNPATFTTSTVQLRDSAGNLVPATVSYDSTTFTATLTPSALLAFSTTYRVTIVGGANGVKSQAGDPMATNVTWSFTTVAQPTCPCSLWTTATTPAVAAASDGAAQELGVKFQASLSGFIMGLRFYKGTTNTGPHVGHLWASDGTLLASATFTNESASGWQQVNFASPVAITANTTYVASYSTTVGHYAYDSGYFTSSVTTYPLHALADGAQGGNGVYHLGANGFPNQSFNATNYWVDVVFNTTVAPTVIATSEADGATNIDPGAGVTATFSVAMDPATLTPSTVQLRDPSGTLVNGTVSYDSTTFTATLTPSALLAFSTTYRATIVGGTNGVKSQAGNPMAANVTWAFTTVAQPTCPCSLWTPTTTPTVAAASDGNAQELGVKFQASLAGFIMGLRFYKGTTNTGPHVGHLWASDGTLLASATFTNESASGWQQVNFASPVAITANTTYVASYSTTVGHYAYDSAYFASGVTTYPLRALADGGQGGNGVYHLGTGSFPNQTFNATNYWVDVVFNTTVAPTVVATSEPDGATNIDPGAAVAATFSLAMNPATLTTSTVQLRDSAGTLVPATISYDNATETVTLTPSATLAFSTTYRVTIVGGANGVKDQAGDPMAANVTWAFTTAAQPTCPCSLWTPATTPAVAAASDGNAQELGVKFQASLAGFITGLRFYKGTTNTSPHVGHLWASDGTLLASATFTNESASGWQQVNFASPVAIMANTTYVASYSAPVGNYAYNVAYFTSGVTTFPLRALADGVQGGNGVYHLGTGSFPDQTFNAANYWVDVIFVLPMPPTINTVSPMSGATGVSPGTAVTAAFSQSMNPATITTTTFQLTGPGTTLVPASISYNGATFTATLTPSSPLADGTTYTATVVGGAGGVKDTLGDAMASTVSWSFTTALSSFIDTTVVDFSAGTPDANTYIAQTADGEIVLTPTVGTEFSGTTLPASWTSSVWGTGGTASVANGVLTVDGALAGTVPLFDPGRSLEFEATFSGEPFQHIGFGVDLNNPPWAIFSIGNDGQLHAKTNAGSTDSDTLLGSNWIGAPHHYRIDWNASNLVYTIDGTVVATHAIALTTSMRPLASNFTVGGGTVMVDWLRLTPYAASSTFLSRVFDAGSSVAWKTVTWTSDLPSGTSLVISVRQGTTPTPDSTWTPFATVPNAGATIGGTARYLQYRAQLATTTTGQTPVLEDITITYSH